MITETRDFLLEVGTEELPPKALFRLSKALGEHLTKQLEQAELTHGAVKLFATPRRLAIIVKDLVNKQTDKMMEQRGPNVNVAFTADGRPTPACQGFARSYGVDVADLERITDARGSWVMVKKERLGESAQKLLPELVNHALKNLPVPRLMRWGDCAVSFVRPVHWAVMLYGNEVIDCEVLGVKTSDKTYGHRFHCKDPIVIPEPSKYEELLEQSGHVIPDFVRRKKYIAEQATIQLGDIGKTLSNEELLNEITSLTEWPVLLVGKFDSRFLRLPPEVLILILEKQQRCFPVINDNGKLDAYFVAISNIESKNPQIVIQGNERVILARLTDGEFFYKTDVQYLLESYTDKLEKTVFQTGLGSVYQKTLRLADLSCYIANQINADAQITKRAAELSKSDLMTTMVGEFPELQGVIGYYYALQQGENEIVAKALREQYLPGFAEDNLPQTMEGCALAIADRIDTVVGVFSLGKAPTGDRDPFALRRAIFGVLRIVLEKSLDLDLADLVRRSLRKYIEQVDKFEELLIKNHQTSSKEQEQTLEEIADIIVNKILDFISERQRSWYLDEGIENNVFDAVSRCEPAITKPLDFAKRLYAIKFFQSLEEAQTLSAAHKRVKNILADVKLQDKLELNPKLLKEAAEVELAAKILRVAEIVEKHCETAQYQDALKEMATLKSSVDYFFNTVMVMADDEKVRNNRLALLLKLRNLFHSVADISYLTIAK